jgi:hypothetical protein
MGIHSERPSDVLVQATPSGGRHYYVFLNDLYFLDQIRDLLELSGLKHVPGATEFFPAMNQALRLPFGYIPGQPHDPTAWIQFIDDYKNRRIRRFSIAELYEGLNRHQDRWARQRQSVLQKRSVTTSSATASLPNTEPVLGPTKADKASTERYLVLLEGIHSPQEAEELMSLGIRVPGTRTEDLKHLAAHLIWVRKKTPEEAAQILTTWVMNPRHESKDVAHDLETGSTSVADQINRMCRWYKDQQRSSPSRGSNHTAVKFSTLEVSHLQKGLVNLPPEDRIPQVHFLLHFLRFAKAHPAAPPTQTWRDTAPAIRQVVRRWPGCHHMYYKTRMDAAITSGLLKKVKEKVQRADGEGKARTYRLFVPVLPSEEETLDYDMALELLTKEIIVEGVVVKTDSSVQRQISTRGEKPDVSCTTKPGCDTLSSEHKPGPPSLHPKSSGTYLEQGSYQCHPESNEASGLPGPPHVAVGADCSETGKSSCPLTDQNVLSDFASREEAVLQLLDHRLVAPPPRVISIRSKLEKRPGTTKIRDTR